MKLQAAGKRILGSITLYVFIETGRQANVVQQGNMISVFRLIALRFPYPIFEITFDDSVCVLVKIISIDLHV